MKKMTELVPDFLQNKSTPTPLWKYLNQSPETKQTQCPSDRKIHSAPPPPPPPLKKMRGLVLTKHVVSHKVYDGSQLFTKIISGNGAGEKGNTSETCKNHSLVYHEANWKDWVSLGTASHLCSCSYLYSFFLIFPSPTIFSSSSFFCPPPLSPLPITWFFLILFFLPPQSLT